METRWNYFVVLTTFCFTSGSPNLLPVLTHDMNNIALAESTPVGTVVYNLQGIHPNDRPLTYSLMGTDQFSVDPYTGEVTLISPLNREEQAKIEFLVSVEDNELSEDQKLVQPVTVIVLDENDTPPTFEKQVYEVSVQEDTKVGKVILDDIVAVDEDQVGEKLEGGCEYNIQSPEACDNFELIGVNGTQNYFVGMLVVKKPLNYDEREFYRFKMYVEDGKFKSNAFIQIKVLDVQNSPPVFIGPLSAVLPEDAAEGTLALVVRVTDGDISDPRPVVLELIHNPMGFFTLNNVTGELRTAKPLVRDALPDPSKPVYLIVRATEVVNGSPMRTDTTSSDAVVAITIQRVEDGIIDSETYPVRYGLMG